MAESLITRIKATTDYYEILEVERTATEKQIKFSYRKKALLLHPDRCNLPDAKTAFQKLSNAHMCLSDAEKRKRYDVSGSDGETPFAGGGGGQPFAGNGFAGFHGAGIPPEIFEEIFRSARSGNMRGGRGSTFHFSSSGFPGGGFSFGQNRRARTEAMRAQQATANARQAAAAEQREAAAKMLRESWLYRMWHKFLGDKAGKATQVLAFLLIFLALMVGGTVLSRHFFPFCVFVVFSQMNGLRKLRAS